MPLGLVADGEINGLGDDVRTRICHAPDASSVSGALLALFQKIRLPLLFVRV
ncbi:MAG: hypothetical protein M2R45_01302 [Verrucomicrobia subdivision 3 bacterium]|nr:hypothetical protein [Limisphaerales bacterium]MCS1415168.1 hypothetical protein [Limisphaerales bacterium]